MIFRIRLQQILLASLTSEFPGTQLQHVLQTANTFKMNLSHSQTVFAPTNNSQITKGCDSGLIELLPPLLLIFATSFQNFFQLLCRLLACSRLANFVFSFLRAVDRFGGLVCQLCLLVSSTASTLHGLDFWDSSSRLV